MTALNHCVPGVRIHLFSSSTLRQLVNKVSGDSSSYHEINTFFSASAWRSHRTGQSKGQQKHPWQQERRCLTQPFHSPQGMLYRPHFMNGVQILFSLLETAWRMIKKMVSVLTPPLISYIVINGSWFPLLKNQDFNISLDYATITAMMKGINGGLP